MPISTHLAVFDTRRAGMAQVAALVEPGWEALLKRDYHQLASLMRLNFRLRRQLYGDAVLGPTNLKMVQVWACGIAWVLGGGCLGCRQGATSCLRGSVARAYVLAHRGQSGRSHRRGYHSH